MVFAEIGHSVNQKRTAVKVANLGHNPPLSHYHERWIERLCMDSSSFASTLFFGDEVRLLTCIRSLFRASRHGTLMGYPRVSSPLLCRASRT